MTTHSFILIFAGDIEPRFDAVYDAGCDDALFGSTDGLWHAGLDRESDLDGVRLAKLS